MQSELVKKRTSNHGYFLSASVLTRKINGCTNWLHSVDWTAALQETREQAARNIGHRVAQGMANAARTNPIVWLAIGDGQGKGIAL